MSSSCPLHRWLIKRVPHMTRVSCDPDSDKAACVLRGVLPGLSGLIAPGAEIFVELDTRRTVELLCCKAGEQPKAAIVDLWHTLSDCLTELSLDLDWTQPQMRLEPQLLTQLTALTSMTFVLREGEAEDAWAGDVLNLPKLKFLHVKLYCGSKLILECPSLTDLVLEECEPLGLISLQAPLRDLDARSSGAFTMHSGFPLTNLLQLIWLRIECRDVEERQLLEALPLMTKLQTLHLGLCQGRLLRSLPQGLYQVTLHYTTSEGWNDGVIPVLQQLPRLRDLEIGIRVTREDTYHRASLSCDLRPFMAMQQLRTLQLGQWQAWTPSSLRALGDFHAEILRSGSKVKLTY